MGELGLRENVSVRGQPDYGGVPGPPGAGRLLTRYQPVGFPESPISLWDVSTTRILGAMVTIVSWMMSTDQQRCLTRLCRSLLATSCRRRRSPIHMGTLLAGYIYGDATDGAKTSYRLTAPTRCRLLPGCSEAGDSQSITAGTGSRSRTADPGHPSCPGMVAGYRVPAGLGASLPSRRRCRVSAGELGKPPRAKTCLLHRLGLSRTDTPMAHGRLGEGGSLNHHQARKFAPQRTAECEPIDERD